MNRKFTQMACRLLLVAAVFLFLSPHLQAQGSDKWNGSDIASQFAGGDGEKATPYQISSAAELAYLAQQVNLGNDNGGSDYSGKYFVLTNDIDLDNQTWTPIGDKDHPFKGKFNGNGYIIKGLNVNAFSFAGLFGVIEDATVEKLGVVIGTKVRTSANNTSYAQAGGIAGKAQGHTTIQNCYTSGGSIETSSGYANNYGGGIVGGGNQCTIRNCYSTCEISLNSTGPAYGGGIIGAGESISVSNCYSTGKIKVVTVGDYGHESVAGGIVGMVNEDSSSPKSTITNCLALNTDEFDLTTGSDGQGTELFPGRILGSKGYNNPDPTLTGNYASLVMPGNWTNIGADQQDGDDWDELYNTTLFPSDSWDISDESHLPQLLGFQSVQPATTLDNADYTYYTELDFSNDNLVTVNNKFTVNGETITLTQQGGYKLKGSSSKWNLVVDAGDNVSPLQILLAVNCQVKTFGINDSKHVKIGGDQTFTVINEGAGSAITLGTNANIELDTNTKLMAISKDDEAITGIPDVDNFFSMIEWQFDTAPTAAMEVREGNQTTNIPSTTSAKHFAVQVTPDASYELWANNKQQWDGTNTTFTTSANKYTVYTGMTAKPDPVVPDDPDPAPDPTPTPPTVYYTVTLPAVEGVTTDPSAGDYEVEAWSSFRFYLTLDKDYDLSEPVVTTDRGETIAPQSSDGAYIVKYVRSDVQISIGGIVKNPDPVANETIEATSPKVWAENSSLHIQAVAAGKVYVYTTEGKLQTARKLEVGEAYSVHLPAGVYLVVIGNERFKVVI
ncbi:DUF6383 domain-containing protein [Parabacteroides sp.]